MNRFGFEPDFENLKTVLLGGRGHRVPNAELVIDREIKDAFLGRPVLTLRDEIEFRYQAGYDYAWVSIGMVDPAGTVNKERFVTDQSRAFAGIDQRSWAEEHTGQIQTTADVAAYPWPKLDEIDYRPLEQAAAWLPPGMKLIAVVGKIFTAAWQLMGFEKFCLACYEQPELVADLLRRLGELQLGVCRRVLQYETVGAIWAPDDVAYHTGPMVSPAWLIEHLYPWYKKMGQLTRQADKPFIYHSDGDMNLLIDTIIDCGINALHPIEPESMDIDELRARVGRRLCLVGNIRVHTLSTAKPAEIRELVRDRVVRLGHQGAYVVGSSNSVPNYVPLENYLAMLQASADYGRIA